MLKIHDIFMSETISNHSNLQQSSENIIFNWLLHSDTIMLLNYCHYTWYKLLSVTIGLQVNLCSRMIEIENAAKRENMQWTFILSFLAVYFSNSQIVEMRWKFSFVCALALYMLNQSKLYLGRRICLSTCLWFYRNNYFCEEHKFQWRYEAKATSLSFSLLAATIHGWAIERYSSDERSIVGKLFWEALWMRLSARDETKWNAKSRESLKLLILFLSCSLNEICAILLHWHTAYSVYVLQHFTDM